MNKSTKQKIQVILTIIIMLITFTSCNAKNKIRISNRDKKWIEDINYLNRSLQKKHAKLYHNIKKKDFDKEIFNLKKDVSKLKDYQITCRISQIVASVGDAHTHLIMNYKREKYPVKFGWFKDEIRVVEIEKKYKNLLGKKLVAINGVGIHKVMKKVDTLISYENSQWLKANDTKYVVYPIVLKYLNITSTEEAEFSFCNKNRIKTVKVSPTKAKYVNMVKIEDNMRTIPVEFQYKCRRIPQNPFWYEYIPKNKTLYFQYNQCMDKKISKMIVKLIGVQDSYKDYKTYPDFKQFTNKMLETVKRKKVNKFIIDLRNNGGGSSVLMNEFAQKLGKKLKKSTKIFIITGKDTFSSGVFAALDLMRYAKAISYGEPTGGNVNEYGDILIIKLPNSKLQISYSTKYFYFSDKYRGNFIPDVVINQSFKDYKNGVDDAYEAIKNYKN